MATAATNELVKREAVPDFMRAQEGDHVGTENMGQYLVPPQIKVVQKQAGEQLLEQFPVGSVIAVPQCSLIAPIDRKESGKSADAGKPFWFVPLLFYPEWVTWTPIELRGAVPAILERTLDEKHDIVRLARDSQLRQEVFKDVPEKDGKPMYIRHVEHLNFLIALITPDGQEPNEMSGIPIILSFSRAEHFSGAKFCTLTRQRTREGAKLWGCQFEARSRIRPNNPKGTWYGIDASNPSAGSGVSAYVQSPELFQRFTELHDEIFELHAKQLIRADYQPESGENETKPASEY